MILEGLAEGLHERGVFHSNPWGFDGFNQGCFLSLMPWIVHSNRLSPNFCSMISESLAHIGNLEMSLLGHTEVIRNSKSSGRFKMSRWLRNFNWDSRHFHKDLRHRDSIEQKETRVPSESGSLRSFLSLVDESPSKCPEVIWTSEDGPSGMT